MLRCKTAIAEVAAHGFSPHRCRSNWFATDKTTLGGFARSGLKRPLRLLKLLLQMLKTWN